MWLYESEKLNATHVEENDRAVIWVTISVFSCTDWSKPRRNSGFVCLPADIGIGHLTIRVERSAAPVNSVWKGPSYRRQLERDYLIQASSHGRLGHRWLVSWSQVPRLPDPKDCGKSVAVTSDAVENEHSVQCYNWKILLWVLGELKKNTKFLYILAGETKGTSGLFFLRSEGRLSEFFNLF
jgi:hypothetical protein